MSKLGYAVSVSIKAPPSHASLSKRQFLPMSLPAALEPWNPGISLTMRSKRSYQSAVIEANFPLESTRVAFLQN